MNKVGPFGKFFGFVLLIFGFNWFGFVVLPWLMLGHLPPIQNGDDDTDISPFNSSGLAHQGEHIYAANGCVYCHTQQVRDPHSGSDIIRGWGTGGKDSDGKVVTRRTYPRDYIWQGQTFLGNSRDGADLSNVGARFKAADLYAWLYHPYTLDSHSSMPEYRFLFVTQKISGQPSVDALVLPPEYAPPAGYEVLPTEDAKSLVAYLLSLNKNYHLKPDEAGLPYKPPTENKS